MKNKREVVHLRRIGLAISQQILTLYLEMRKMILNYFPNKPVTHGAVTMDKPIAERDDLLTGINTRCDMRKITDSLSDCLSNDF